MTAFWSVDTDICMKTTLNFDDGLLRSAKRRALEEGKTLTGLLEDALRRYLQPAPTRRKPFKLRLKTIRGGLQPGVDLANRDALHDLMDGRD